jgi:hypothetical protein
MREGALEENPGERLSTVRSENPESSQLEIVANNVWIKVILLLL